VQDYSFLTSYARGGRRVPGRKNKKPAPVCRDGLFLSVISLTFSDETCQNPYQLVETELAGP
jgi:hypothetical protein